MRYFGSLVLITGLALAAGGCRDQGPKQDNSPSQTREQLKGRLDAADALATPGKRVDALKKVAEDAADAGEADIAQKAVEKITIPGTKDELAAACALKIASRGDTKAAKALADLISTPGKKEKVMEKIAKGEQ